MRFISASQVTVDDILEKISSIYQSNSSGLKTETFCFGFTTVEMSRGNGRPWGRHYNSFEEECAKRRGIIVVKNKDNLCLPRALVVAMAYREKNPQLTQIRQDICKLQGKKTIELMNDANVVIPKAGERILW